MQAVHGAVAAAEQHQLLAQHLHAHRFGPHLLRDACAHPSALSKIVIKLIQLLAQHLHTHAGGVEDLGQKLDLSTIFLL